MSVNQYDFELYSVDLERRGDGVFAHSRPINVQLTKGEPVLNPKGILLEHASQLLERRQAKIVVLTCGKNEKGEPMLDHLGYIGVYGEPTFTDVQPTSLYALSEVFKQVSVIKVAFDNSGAGHYQEDTNVHSAIFTLSGNGALRPFEQNSAVLWPQDLLDTMHAHNEYQQLVNGETLMNSVALNSVYYRRKYPQTPEGGYHYECFAVCLSREKRTWLSKAKEVIKGALEMEREAIKDQLMRLDGALHQLNGQAYD
ncbi:hypothetical protein [Pseudoalteromonas umbrosa]|uniref:hypothetical protein n=1 Tax=Pseudoalteromonas umbrosa TaxID=3048489 RepID=UPI0024C39623|nr:hypothetical protein [Pseudoalteromonas sp. B95]MDK1290081.1 hypothetical protein [Pseudoalteromonas sp. B95]